MSQADRLLEAAIARMARGDGQGKMLDLGIQGAEAVKDGHVSKGVLYKPQLRAQGKGSAVRELVAKVMDHLLDEQLRLREVAIENYATQAQSIADGAGRETIASALLKEMQLYGGVAEGDELARARERAYYLAIALCDVAISQSGEPISADSKKPVPDLRFRRHLLEIHGRHRAALIKVYREFLAVAEREPVHSVETVERAIGTFIEGALVFRRIATSHSGVSPRSAGSTAGDLMLGDEELIDTVLRLFMAMSRPIGGEAPDPEAVLFRRSNHQPMRSVPDAVLHLEAESVYGSLQGLIDDLGEGDELAHCSLHSSGAVRSRTPATEALSDAIGRFAGRGGQLRNIEKIGSVAELDTTVAKLEAQNDAGQDVRYRALLMDAPPGHSPLLIGDRTAFLTRHEDGLIIDAVAFGDEAGRQWCRAHYEALWADERAFTLLTPNGLNHHRIAEARAQLEGLEKQRQSRVEA